MRKTRLFSILALLLMAATGAWAQTPNSIVINGTPLVGDKSISLTYYFDPANVTGLESFAPTLKVKCAADNKWDEILLSLENVSSGTTNISLYNLGEFEAGKTYEVCFAYNNGNWVDEVFQSFVPAATYSITLQEGTEDAGNWSVPAEAAEGATVTVTYSGEKKVKSVKAVKKVAPAPTYTLLSAATAADQGKVVCAAGHLHDAKTAVPSGCTAVGILGKVTGAGHGLILALKEASEQKWNTINGWGDASYAGTTLKVLPDDAARGTNLTSYTTLGETTVSNWAVAQKSDYEAIFENLGSTTGDIDGKTFDANVNDYITDAGGTAISSYYWSATEYGGTYNTYAWVFLSSYWNGHSKETSVSVWPVLGF